MTPPPLATWLAFSFYLGGTFLLAWLAHRHRSGASFMEDYFVAGREIGPWVLALTWVATAASGGTFIGAPALAYTYGWVLLLWISAYMVFATTGVGLVGKRISEIGRRTGALTYPDLMRDRFESPSIGVLSAVGIIVLYLAYMVAQFVAGARLLEAILGVPYLVGVVSFAAVVSLYTAYGGFRAVAWTDAFQALVMLFGVLAALFFAVKKVGGMQAVFDSLEAQDPALLSGPGPGDFLPLSVAISFFAIYALSAAGQPSLLTRFLTCRDTATIRRACFIIGVYILLLYPAVMTLGVVGRALVPELEAADHAMPATILAATPAALAGVLLAAPFAAIMSTVSSYLLVTSSAVVRDLYARNRTGVLSERRAATLTHGSTFGLAGLTLVFALQPPAFLQYIVIFAGTGLAATFLFPTLFAIYWPRMNHAGFIAGMTAGFVSFVAQYALWRTRSVGGFDPFVWSLIVSAAFSAGGVRLGKRTSAKILEIYFDGGAIF